MPFQKGNPGRPTGALNKITRSVKERVLDAFEQLQEDEKNNLLAWAKSEPTEFYKIAAKLIPAEINAHIDNKVIEMVNPSDPKPEEWEEN